jgi:serine phosphatase RsbU (regulator of sigma subunit)
MDETLLKQIPLFSNLPDGELGHLIKLLHPCDLEAGTILFYESEIGDRLSIILEGEVEVIKALGTSEERLLAVLSNGDFIGEMSLLYRDRQRSASARTRTRVRLLELTQADFNALLNRLPELAFAIMEEMSLRLRNTENATIRDLQAKNAQLAQAYHDLKTAQAQLIQKEKMEHELKMARRIQESILPKEIPDPPGWDLAAFWQPARSVSGDFYDFIPFPRNRMGIVIGDVTDKGVPAALVMATTRTTLRATALSMADEETISPGELLGRVNEFLCPDMPAYMFVTCLFAVLDLSSGEMFYANAGHPLPYQRTARGILDLRASGMPLGLIPGMIYDDKETSLSAGDCVLMYSDGLVEAHNPQGEMFSFNRLRDLMSCELRGDALIQYLLGKLGDFTGVGWEQEDDVTFVSVARLSATSQSSVAHLSIK